MPRLSSASGTALLPVTGPQTASMQTSDGIRLDADVYRPEYAGHFPVLLMRQPYGRRIASTVTYTHPSWYAANGYIVVVQDVRGRGSSQGRFRLFADDVRDGGESIAWAAALPGSTGRVGMYGFSYQGHTQMLALAAGRPELQALCPAMMTWNVRDEWAYEGGAFGLLGNLHWGLQMAAEQARLAGDEAAFEALFAASRAVPLHSSRPCRPDVLEQFAHYGHYRDWLTQPEHGAYWKDIAVGHALDGKPMNVPMLHIGGWYDLMLGGTLHTYREACARSRKPQRLVIGPWTHMPWGRRAGADFGPQAVSDIDALQVAWFDRFLKDIDNGVDRAAPVRLFDLIANEWREFEAWPSPVRRALYLSSDGLAATTLSGGLSEQKPARVIRDVIVHDPWRPVPSLGGHNAEQGGMQERSGLDSRADVLVYTSEPAAAALLLAGDVELTLSVRADQPSFDVSAVLSRVTPDGRAFNLTQGYCRVDDPGNAPVHLNMRALCATLPAGDSLRLSLAAASFPAFAVNPGTGAAPADARLIDNRIITLSIESGGAMPSRIDLPTVG
jgi:putative CocE/NonD family hydrolase